MSAMPGFAAANCGVVPPRVRDLIHQVPETFPTQAAVLVATAANVCVNTASLQDQCCLRIAEDSAQLGVRDALVIVDVEETEQSLDRIL
eukprot:CAMPEP_0115562490 /NCGR_PEP_ID=MMETSP0271-20121206/101537_1 /TAXON_ID=71861 /ORGANISM="Scrippsiella trochoidea, Strain CCMP3099" /LENGTH=88 /DNA_ID=CAMNT_0002996651 /DNA_START=335 /DNA_END=601 /DNA_ORIENTATION=+